MEFEFDPAKSQANKVKHGIDFQEAQGLWLTGDYIEFPVFSKNEPRTVRIAPLEDKLWLCVFTMRGEKIRLISVRHVRPAERKLYEQNH